MTTNLDQAILDAQARVDDNLAHLTTLGARRTKALDALGAARATGGDVDVPRAELKALDTELEERTAASPHLERAHAAAITARDMAVRGAGRARLKALSAERLNLAGVIDQHVQALAAALTAANTAANEMMALHRKLGDPGADSLIPRRAEGLRHVLAWALKRRLGNLPANIAPTRQISVLELEQELLSEEG